MAVSLVCRVLVRRRRRYPVGTPSPLCYQRVQLAIVMPLIWITGISGSGKSAVRRELRSRGYEAYGTDEDGFAQWVEIESGVITPRASAGVSDRSPGFLARNDWRVDVKRVRALAAEAKDKLIFLCGSVQNEIKVWEFFEKAILLSVDEETIRKRIESRTENDFGKSDHELALILGWNQNIESNYEGYGAFIVDARMAISDIVDEVVRIVEGRADG
jgi:dephospho-CoA kinase